MRLDRNHSPFWPDEFRRKYREDPIVAANIKEGVSLLKVAQGRFDKASFGRKDVIDENQLLAVVGLEYDIDAQTRDPQLAVACEQPAVHIPGKLSHAKMVSDS